MSADDCVGCKHINNCLGDCVGYEEVKPQEQTNEEWLRQCSTEELAEFLIKSIKMCKSCASGIGIELTNFDCPFGECGCSYKYEVMNWLQEKHN